LNLFFKSFDQTIQTKTIFQRSLSKYFELNPFLPLPIEKVHLFGLIPTVSAADLSHSIELGLSQVPLLNMDANESQLQLEMQIVGIGEGIDDFDCLFGLEGAQGGLDVFGFQLFD
jgi:hypothetical protein